MPSLAEKKLLEFGTWVPDTEDMTTTQKVRASELQPGMETVFGTVANVSVATRRVTVAFGSVAAGTHVTRFYDHSSPVTVAA